MSTLDAAVDACLDVEAAREELRRRMAHRDEVLARLAKEMSQRQIPRALADRGVSGGASLANVRLALRRVRS